VQEHHIRVARTARYFMLGNRSPDVTDVWFVCHGYGQLATDFLAAFQVIADPQRLVVAPEALNRFYPGISTGPHGPDSPVGATWMTRVDRLAEIDDYVEYLDTLYRTVLEGIEPTRVTGLGFSQGAATVCRWAASTEQRIDRVVLFGGALPPEMNVTPALFKAATLTIVLGKHDATANPDRIASERRRMEQGGLSYDLLRFPGGHRLDDGVLRQLAQTV
jgi:predicted esterase